MTQDEHIFVHSPQGLKMIQRRSLVPNVEGSYYPQPPLQQQAASGHRAGRHSGLHPEDAPFITNTGTAQQVRQTKAPANYDTVLVEEEELDGYDEYPTRSPRSAIRYSGEEEISRQGNTRLYAGQVVIPKQRRSQHTQLPPAQKNQQEIYTEDIDEHPAPKPKRGYTRRFHFHPLVWLGLGMIAMFFLWVGWSNALNWWQIHQDDSTYGRPRTYQIDAVVGHGDSQQNPSHFIAINLNRHIIVIEIPGGDTSKSRIYNITTLFGDGQDLTPVTITFQASAGNGKPDMIIYIQDQRIPFYNDGTQFRSTK